MNDVFSRITVFGSSSPWKSSSHYPPWTFLKIPEKHLTLKSCLSWENVKKSTYFRYVKWMCSAYKSYSAESSRIYTSDELSKTTNYPSLVDNSSKNPVFRQKWGQISSIVGCLALCVVVAIFRVNFGDHRGLAPLENVQFFRTKMCGLRSFIRISEMMETVL